MSYPKAWRLLSPKEMSSLEPPVLLTLQVGKYFQIKERKSNLTQELRAGTVTFLTVGQLASMRKHAVLHMHLLCKR